MTWTHPVLCRSCSDNHSCTEFKRAVAISFPEDSILQHPTLPSVLTFLLLPPLPGSLGLEGWFSVPLWLSIYSYKLLYKLYKYIYLYNQVFICSTLAISLFLTKWHLITNWPNTYRVFHPTQEHMLYSSDDIPGHKINSKKFIKN